MGIHEALQSNNFDEYKKFVSSSGTSFEPNAKGILIEGLDFQKFYLNEPNKTKITVVNPKVKILSNKSAMTTCTLLHQRMSSGAPVRILVDHVTLKSRTTSLNLKSWVWNSGFQVKIWIRKYELENRNL